MHLDRELSGKQRRLYRSQVVSRSDCHALLPMAWAAKPQVKSPVSVPSKLFPANCENHLRRPSNGEAAKAVIRKAIVQANEEIMAMGALDREMKNMGTTVVMAVWRKGSEIFVTGVGDSRVYRIRDRKSCNSPSIIRWPKRWWKPRLSPPPKPANTNSATCSGNISAPKRSAKAPRLRSYPIQGGDRFLLCTDGLHGVVSDDKLLHFISRKRMSNLCRRFRATRPRFRLAR